MTNNFGQLLAHKRKEARLSIPELSELSGVGQAQLEAIEEGMGELPTFDMCYKFGQVLTARSGQLFVFQDLWIALKSDRLNRQQPGLVETVES